MHVRRSLLCVFLLVAGCAGVPEQTFNVTRSSISTIAIAQPVYQEELLLRYRNDQLETVDMISPVPVGRFFAYLAKENREADFTERANTASSTLASDLKSALKHELESLRFETVDARAPNDSELSRTRSNLLKRIPIAAFNGADALLETSGEIGFTAAGRGKPYQPALWINVRLTQNDGTTLFQDRIIYNPTESNVLGVILYPSETLSFDTRDDLLDSETTTAALREATKTVAKELAFLLRGPVLDVN